MLSTEEIREKQNEDLSIEDYEKRFGKTTITAGKLILQLRLLARTVGKVYRPYFEKIHSRLDALESKTASMADAGIVGTLQSEVQVLKEQIRQLQSSRDKEAQIRSATSKQVQALERKFGGFIHAK